MKVEIPMESVIQIHAEQKPGYDIFPFSFDSYMHSILESLPLMERVFESRQPRTKLWHWMGSKDARMKKVGWNKRLECHLTIHTIIMKDSKRDETENFKMRFPSTYIETIIKFSNPIFNILTSLQTEPAISCLTLTLSISFSLALILPSLLLVHNSVYAAIFREKKKKKKNDFDIVNTQTAQFYLDLVTVELCVALHIWNNVSKIKKSLQFESFVFCFLLMVDWCKVLSDTHPSPRSIIHILISSSNPK